jgi:hypothetical protein
MFQCIGHSALSQHVGNEYFATNEYGTIKAKNGSSFNFDESKGPSSFHAFSVQGIRC